MVAELERLLCSIQGRRLIVFATNLKCVARKRSFWLSSKISLTFLLTLDITQQVFEMWTGQDYISQPLTWPYSHNYGEGQNVCGPPLFDSNPLSDLSHHHKMFFWPSLGYICIKCFIMDHWLTDWPTDWSIDWLIDWSIVFIYILIEWFIPTVSSVTCTPRW